MLTRLIYASETAAPLDPATLTALLSQARRNNGVRDITGHLLFDSHFFLQVLEGERQILSDLYGRLVTDPRHQRLSILGCETVNARQFGRWAMGFTAADATGRSLYLRHGPTSRFEPYRLSAGAALALLLDARAESAEACAAG